MIWEKLAVSIFTERGKRKKGYRKEYIITKKFPDVPLFIRGSRSFKHLFCHSFSSDKSQREFCVSVYMFLLNTQENMKIFWGLKGFCNLLSLFIDFVLDFPSKKVEILLYFLCLILSYNNSYCARSFN